MRSSRYGIKSFHHCFDVQINKENIPFYSVCDALRNLVSFGYLENVKNTSGGVTLLVMLQASRFLNCTNVTKSCNVSHLYLAILCHYVGQFCKFFSHFLIDWLIYASPSNKSSLLYFKFYNLDENLKGQRVLDTVPYHGIIIRTGITCKKILL